MPIFKTHLNHNHKVPVDGIWAFYLNAFLRSLTFALASIFVPIFIYQLTAVSPAVGIIMVLVFYFLVRLVIFVLALPLSRLVEKIGFRWSIGLSNCLLIAYFFLLELSPGRIYFLFLAALVLGAGIPLYWISRYSAITEDAAEGKLGRQIGLISSLERVAGILGPISGALIIKTWGYGWLYSAAALILAASFIPLMFMPHHLHRNGVSWRHFLDWLEDKNFVHQAVAFAGRAVDDYSWNVFWPLAVFLLGINLKTLGLVFSFIALLTVVSRFISGIWFDRRFGGGRGKEGRAFSFLAAANGVVWLARLAVKTVWGVVTVDSFSAVLSTPYRNISDSYIFMGGRRMHEIAYYTYHELVYSLAIMVYLSFLMLVVYRGGSWKTAAFTVTAVVSLITIIQRREGRIKVK